MPRVVAVAAILAVWALVSAWVGSDDLPSPADVWGALTSNLTGDDGLLAAAWGSLVRLAISLAVAIGVGTLTGVAMAAAPWVQRSVGTVMTALQAIPPIVWLPMAIIWFGFTERAVIFVVIIGAIPAVAIATATAVRQVPVNLVRAGRVMGASGWELYRNVVMPAAVPGYWTGLQQAWAVAWRALLAAELIRTGVAKGLGHVLDASLEGTTVLDPALILATMVVVVIIGLGIDALFSVVDRRIRRRRGMLVPA